MIKEVEFSKNGEGKVMLGIGCRKKKDNYQKFLNIANIAKEFECKAGDQFLHGEVPTKGGVSLVFNNDKSIDQLIEKLKELKRVNPEEKLTSDLINQLPLGC